MDVRADPRFASADLVLRSASQELGVALARNRLAADDVAYGILIQPFGEMRVPRREAYWIVRGSMRRIERPTAP